MERVQGYLSEAEVEISIDRDEPLLEDLVEELTIGESTINVFNFVVDQVETGRVSHSDRISSQSRTR